MKPNRPRDQSGNHWLPLLTREKQVIRDCLVGGFWSGFTGVKTVTKRWIVW